MAMTDFTIISRSLSSRRFSTITTSLTVAVAVALMLTLLSLRDSGRKAFERGSGNIHLLISRDASSLASVLNGLFYANAPQRYIEWAKFKELEGELPIEWIIPTQLGDSYRGLPVLATTPDFFTKFKPAEDTAWAFAEGRAFEKDFEVVVGADAARQAGIRMGAKIALTHGVGKAVPGVAAPHVHNEYKFTVVGILKPSGTIHDRALVTNLMSSWILHAHDRIEAEAHASGKEDEHAHEDDHDHDHDHDHAHGDHDHDHDHEPTTTAADVLESDKKITGVLLRLPTRGGSDTSAMLPVVYDMLRRDGSVTVAEPAQEIGRLFTIVGSIDQVFVAMAAAVLVSSGIAIMLALYNSMEQRRRQIAVLRVLGCSKPRIFGLILTESAMLGVAGAVLGVALAFIGLQIVVGVIKETQGIIIEPSMVPPVMLGVVVGTVLLAAAAGIVPAMMAYQTPVAKNLKPLG